LDAPRAAAHVAGAPEAPGEKAGTSFERWALVVIVLAMILLPTLEAAVRRFTGSGVPGAAVYTQHLTLWVGFLGAMLATSTGHHLALSTVDFLREGWPRELARAFDSAVTTLVCALLAYASLDMVLLDKGRVDTLAGGVPEWWFEVVMPVGFAVMSIRGAMKAPSRGAKAACWILIAAVLPFVVSRALAVEGEGFLTMPDGPTLLRGHTAALGCRAACCFSPPSCWALRCSSSWPGMRSCSSIWPGRPSPRFLRRPSVWWFRPPCPRSRCSR